MGRIKTACAVTAFVLLVFAVYAAISYLIYQAV